MFSCCFTGHRELSDSEDALRERLKNTVKSLIDEGAGVFYAGGARGFDTVAAEVVLELKKEYPHIKLILALPCTNQTRGWKKEDAERYDHILDFADDVIYVSEHYFDGCMHMRNRYLVDNSEYCICYYNKTSGGTAYTVKYAIKHGRKIINCAE